MDGSIKTDTTPFEVAASELVCPTCGKFVQDLKVERGPLGPRGAVIARVACCGVTRLVSNLGSVRLDG